MILTKEKLATDLAAEGYHIYRIARVLAISERQVIRLVYKGLKKDKRNKKPRKPKVKR